MQIFWDVNEVSMEGTSFEFGAESLCARWYAGCRMRHTVCIIISLLDGVLEKKFLPRERDKKLTAFWVQKLITVQFSIDWSVNCV